MYLSSDYVGEFSIPAVTYEEPKPAEPVPILEESHVELVNPQELLSEDQK